MLWVRIKGCNRKGRSWDLVGLVDLRGKILAEAETQEEVSDAGAVNVVKLIEDQNSYIKVLKKECMTL